MRRAAVAIVVAFAALVGVGIAWAAAIAVTPQKLTIFAYCRVSNSEYDSDVDQSSPTSNFGSSSDLYVRSKSGSGNRRTFVKFNLTNCTIPTTATVTAATVSLYLSSAPGTSRTWEIRRANAAWTEGGITWNNQPAVGAVTSSTTTGTTGGVRRTWSVGVDVEAFTNGSATNNGWRISDAVENDGASPEGKFASQEWGTGADRPLLTVTYYP
jgi:hypothetical protein